MAITIDKWTEEDYELAAEVIYAETSIYRSDEAKHAARVVLDTVLLNRCQTHKEAKALLAFVPASQSGGEWFGVDANGSPVRER